MGSLAKFISLLFLGSFSCFLSAQNVPNTLQEAHTLVKIKGGKITIGNDSISDARPSFNVKIQPFWMQKYEVTNAQFMEFVKQTHYVTLAEKLGGSFIFDPTQTLDSAHSIKDTPWWKFEVGANWQHPEGKESDIHGKEWHPVVHIAYEDACAYCDWLKMRLPTEVEREYVAQANGSSKAINIWQGNFPFDNAIEDSFYKTSPVGSFPAGKLDLYDIQGNVWEWCADPYHQNAYHYVIGTNVNSTQVLVPTYFDLDSPDEETRVIRGGSFLCHDNYCCGYLPNRRMRASVKMSFEHIGFRCVKSKK